MDTLALKDTFIILLALVFLAAFIGLIVIIPIFPLQVILSIALIAFVNTVFQRAKEY